MRSWRETQILPASQRWSRWQADFCLARARGLRRQAIAPTQERRELPYAVAAYVKKQYPCFLLHRSTPKICPHYTTAAHKALAALEPKKGLHSLVSFLRELTAGTCFCVPTGFLASSYR